MPVFGCEKKPESLKKTQTGKGRTCKLHTGRPQLTKRFKLETFSLWGNSANYCTAMQPTLQLPKCCRMLLICHLWSVRHLNFSIITRQFFPKCALIYVHALHNVCDCAITVNLSFFIRCFDIFRFNPNSIHTLIIHLLHNQQSCHTKCSHLGFFFPFS